MTRTPLVTVVVPALNEASHIGRSLAAVAAQAYPADLLEVVVVDGGSTDGTADAANEAFDRLGLRNARVVVNAGASTPSNLNTGLHHAHGEILCRVDARSLIPRNYVARCVDLLVRLPDMAVVGGRQVAVAPREDAVGRGIARALNNHWSMGLSRYRRGAASGTCDTVYLGAFRTQDLRDVGGWDERLGTNQDFDLNRRLRSKGVVWFDCFLEVGYVPRGDIAALFRQYHRFGRWKVRYWRLTGDRPRPRQVAILLGAPVMSAAALGCFLSTSGRGRRRLVVGCVAVAGLLDTTGSDAPAGDPRSSLVALCALASTSLGWLTGVGRELVAPDGRATGGEPPR